MPYLVVAKWMMRMRPARISNPRVAITHDPGNCLSIRRVHGSIPNQYIVVLNDPLPSSDVPEVANQLVQQHRGTILHIYRHALKGFAAKLTDAAAAAIALDPRVDFVEEDGVAFLVQTQINPPSWGLDRIDQRTGLDGAYSYTNTGDGVNVYVIDSGIRTTHQDFGGRAFIGADFIGDGQNGNDCNGHGTHVAGTIGGNTYGVAKAVTLWAVRVFGCTTSSPWSTIIAGVNWVAAKTSSPRTSMRTIRPTTSSARRRKSRATTWCAAPRARSMTK